MKKRKLARKVSVIGAGSTVLGDVRNSEEIKDFSERELVAQACTDAMKDAHIKSTEIDAFYMGMSSPNTDAKVKGGAPFFAEWIGMRYKPTIFQDAGCASGGVGLCAAVNAVASGMYDCVLVTGVNINMSAPDGIHPPYMRKDFDPAIMWDNIYDGIDAAYCRPATGGLVGYDSDMLCYSKTYGVSKEEIEEGYIEYMIDKRKEAVLNPKAALVHTTFEDEAKKVGLASAHDYLKSKKYNPAISSYGHAEYMGKAMDGSAAVIVCASELADKYTDKPVEVAGIATSCCVDKDYPGLKHPEDMNMFETAYAMADITDPYTQIDHMYIHDCPALTLPIVLEEAGYVKPGETFKHMLQDDFTFNGSRPLNTNGGRTQFGHPRSPAYLIEIGESINQMKGLCGARQMPQAPKTSVLWGGGTGISKVVTVLKRQW